MDAVMIGLRVLVSLGAVLALLWWLHRKLTSGTRSRASAPVQIVAKQGIGAKASVVVIDVEGSRLVLGVTEQSVSVLQTTDAPAPAVEFARSMDAAASASPAPIELFSRPQFASAQFAQFTPAQFGTAQFGGKSPIAGSILSLDTWRQAATTLRRAR